MLIARVHGVLVQVEIWNNLRTVTDGVKFSGRCLGNMLAVEEEAQIIVKSLGFLALAIEQAAAYVRNELVKDIFKFRSTYAVQRRKFLGRETSGNTYYKNTVA